MSTISQDRQQFYDFVKAGLFEFMRSLALSSPDKENAFQDYPTFARYSCGMDYAPCNGILEKSDVRTISDSDVAAAIQFFDTKKIPFIWWTSQNLEKHGLQFGGNLKGIVADIPSLKFEEFNQEITVKKIQSPEDIFHFSKIGGDILGLNEKSLRIYFEINKTAQKNAKQMHFLAYCNGIPVGTLSLSTNENSAGLWNAVTLPEYRRKGIMTSLSYHAVEEAKRLKYDKIMAILMPKGLAWGAFQKIGFQEVCNFPFYIHGVNANELEK